MSAIQVSAGIFWAWGAGLMSLGATIVALNHTDMPRHWSLLYLLLAVLSAATSVEILTAESVNP